MRIIYDELIKVKRMKTVSGNRRAYVATSTAEASIQPLGKDRNQIQEGVFGQIYQAYVETDTNVQVGDKVVDREGNGYLVSEVQQRDFGAFPHTVITMKRS